jgi:hypothetical protein
MNGPVGGAIPDRAGVRPIACEGKDKVKVDDVRFVKELYPRLREDDAAIERYRAALDKLPPIVVARDGILVDGFHRWQAHRREGVDEISAENLGNLSDAEILRESITRNAAHGQQLSAKDKQNLAGLLWLQFGHLQNAERVSEIAQMLSVSERSVQSWTKDARKAEKEQAQAKAWDLWLDCNTYRDIAAQIEDRDEDTVGRWVSAKAQDFANADAPESRQHFDVWTFPPTRDDSAGSTSYFGVMPPQVVENLLWFWTEPGDIVFDPFAGSGTTIDVCKRMGRRVWSSDRKPSTPTLPIHEWDIANGWPDDAPKRAKLTILDPPYWQQAAGKYSDDAADFGNMELGEFRDAWASVVRTACEHSDVVAYIISPTQTDNGVVDHAYEMALPFTDSGWTISRRIIVPYSTQQATGQQVEWARANKTLLKLYRDLVVMAPGGGS